MSVYSANMISWPIAVCLIVIDTWLVFAVLLLVARRYARCHPHMSDSFVGMVVDGPVNELRQRLIYLGHRAFPEWLPWLVTIMSAIFARYSLTLLGAAIRRAL